MQFDVVLSWGCFLYCDYDLCNLCVLLLVWMIENVFDYGLELELLSIDIDVIDDKIVMVVVLMVIIELLSIKKDEVGGIFFQGVKWWLIDLQLWLVMEGVIFGVDVQGVLIGEYG